MPHRQYPFYAVVEDEFSAVNQLIVDRLASHIPMVEEIAHYLIDAFRPIQTDMKLIIAGDAA